jgi:hypothetical protein
MDLRDLPGGRSRRAAADSAAQAVAHELEGRYDVRTASFDAALGPFDKNPAKGLAFKGGGETALGDAIRFSLNRIDPDSVAAMLVLSDGVVNRGSRAGARGCGPALRAHGGRPTVLPRWALRAPRRHRR